MAVGIRDKIREKTQDKLRPNEQVQVVFGAQTASNWWLLAFGIFFFFMNEFRCVVVTNERILVFRSGKFASANPNELVAEVSRSTRIGPPKGPIWYSTDALGDTLKIHKRFHKDIEQADALIPPQPA